MSDEIPSEWEALREQLAKQRLGLVAARRALLELVPGDLRDLDAAAECNCSCHPQPGRDPHHGRRCSCQISERARRARQRKAVQRLAELPELRETLAPRHRQHLLEIAEAAEELGVEVHEEVIGAPFVLTGVTDGVAWYLRERFDTYALVVSSGEDPTIQPWSAPTDVETITIRTGTSDDIYVGNPPDHRLTVRFIVGQVREHLARTSCQHPARPGDRYCPNCGTGLVDPAIAR